MILEILVPVVIGLSVFTLLYKIIPHRVIGEKKPHFAPLPKYQKVIRTNKANDQIKDQLESFGFKQISDTGSLTKYKRGSVLGDFSINLARVNIGVTRINESSVKLTAEAGWFVAFDTGDFWALLSELSEIIES